MSVHIEVMNTCDISVVEQLRDICLHFAFHQNTFFMKYSQTWKKYIHAVIVAYNKAMQEMYTFNEWLFMDWWGCIKHSLSCSTIVLFTWHGYDMGRWYGKMKLITYNKSKFIAYSSLLRPFFENILIKKYITHKGNIITNWIEKNIFCAHHYTDIALTCK